MATGAVAAPHRLIITRRMAAVLEVDVVLVGPEVRDLCVGRRLFSDRGADPAPMALCHLPVLDADCAPEHRVLMERDVAADIDVLAGSQCLVDAHAAALDREAERLR